MVSRHFKSSKFAVLTTTPNCFHKPLARWQGTSVNVWIMSYVWRWRPTARVSSFSISICAEPITMLPRRWVCLLVWLIISVWDMYHFYFNADNRELFPLKTFKYTKKYKHGSYTAWLCNQWRKALGNWLPKMVKLSGFESRFWFLVALLTSSWTQNIGWWDHSNRQSP